jgi:hypothetical protein
MIEKRERWGEALTKVAAPKWPLRPAPPTFSGAKGGGPNPLRAYLSNCRLVGNTRSKRTSANSPDVFASNSLAVHTPNSSANSRRSPMIGSRGTSTSRFSMMPLQRLPDDCIANCTPPAGARHSEQIYVLVKQSNRYLDYLIKVAIGGLVLKTEDFFDQKRAP